MELWAKTYFPEVKHVEEDGDLHQVDPPADVVVPDHEQVNISVEQVTWPGDQVTQVTWLGDNQMAITSSPSNRRLAHWPEQVVIDQSRMLPEHHQVAAEL